MKVVMASIDFTSEELFACPFDPYCLGMCSWTSCPRNADVALPVSPECDLSLRPPSCANEQNLSVSTSRFAFASKEELSKLAEGITQANTTKATAWAINNFNSGWQAEIVFIPVTLYQTTFFNVQTQSSSTTTYLSMWSKQSRMEISTFLRGVSRI